MDIRSETWPVFSTNKKRAKIDTKPPYQRGPVWSNSNKQLFIDSMLRGFDIPKIYLRKINHPQYDWEIIDGQQRLRAIWEFFGEEYCLAHDSDTVDGCETTSKSYGQLNDKLSDTLDMYGLSVVIIEDADDDEVEDMFLRLQNGLPLNSAEKRNAISGNMRDFIRDEAGSNKLMTESVPFGDKRYSHAEVVAQMMCIEINGGPTSVRHHQLKRMYESHMAFSKTSKEAAKLKKVMAFLSKAFPKKKGELTKVNLLSLYTVASASLSKYVISRRAKEFGKWFVDFEKRRWEEEKKPGDEIDERMATYQSAVRQQTANLASQKTRQYFLTEDMLQHIPNIVPLDNKSQFTYDQRTAIFRKFDGKCVNPSKNLDCVIECQWDNFHADHIKPYSKGGRTAVVNGQLLCISCNLKKSDN